jgi:plasmid maintenance system killer protein
MFWMNSNDQDSLKLSFVSVARQIVKNHPSVGVLSNADFEDLENTVDAVKAWLSIRKNTRWLIVFDNYDNPKVPGNADPAAVDIREFLPESDHGSVIITTRSSQVNIGPRIHVQKLRNIQDGLQILSSTSKRKDIANGRTNNHMVFRILTG